MSGSSSNVKVLFFFDFDGVILDSMGLKTKVFMELFDEYGSRVVQAVRKHHLSNGGMSRYEKFRHYYEVFLGREISKDDLKALDREFSCLIAREIELTEFVSGAQEILQWASQKKELAAYLVSSVPVSELKELCEKKRILPMFSEIFGYPENKSKVMAGIIEKRGVKPTNCVMFGDSPGDFKAARENDLSFIGINVLDHAYFREQGVQCFKDFKELDKDALLSFLMR